MLSLDLRSDRDEKETFYPESIHRLNHVHASSQCICHYQTLIWMVETKDQQVTRILLVKALIGRGTKKGGAIMASRPISMMVLVAARAPDLKRKLSPLSQQVLAVREAALKQLSLPMMMSTS